MPAPTHRGRCARLVALAVLAVLTLGLVACEDDDDVDVPTNLLEVRVREGGLDPQVQQVRLPDRYQLVVTNETDEECIFSLADFVRDLRVPANGTGQVDFQTPPSSDAAPAPGAIEEGVMGCEGRPDLTGRVEILQGTSSGLGAN